MIENANANKNSLLGKVTKKGRNILIKYFTKKDKGYYKKNLMSPNEQKLFKTLNQIVADDYILSPQVPLTSVIRKFGKYKYHYNNLFHSTDFGIFTKEEYTPLLLIELNDNSHKEIERIKRDLSVKKICDSANIKLMTFWTDDLDDYDKIRNDILYSLSSNTDTTINKKETN